LSEYPADALLAAVRDLRREKTFPPSIAELVKAVNARSWTRGWLLKAVESRLNPPAEAPPPSRPADQKPGESSWGYAKRKFEEHEDDEREEAERRARISPSNPTGRKVSQLSAGIV
jgi:hypothetical protein